MTDRDETSRQPARIVQPRRWGALALAGVAALGVGPGTFAGPAAAQTAAVAPAAGEGGEGGEGGTSSAAGTDEAYLEALGQIDGHLHAAMALYREGRIALAADHIDSPDSDAYVVLSSEIAEHGHEGFAKELAALDIAADESAPLPQVEETYARLRARIDALWQKADAEPGLLMMALSALIRGAAEDYAVGVQAGAVVDLGEYQDALGYVEVARAQLSRLTTSSDQKVLAAAKKGLAALDTLAPAFDGSVPDGALGGDAGLLYAAAAQIELAAYPLKTP